MLTKEDRARVRNWVDGRAYFFAELGTAAARGVCELIERHPLFRDMPHPFAVTACEHPTLGRGLLVAPSCWRGSRPGGARAAWALTTDEMLRRYGQIPTSLLFPSWPKAPDFEAARAGVERFHKWERVRPNIYRGVLG